MLPCFVLYADKVGKKEYVVLIIKARNQVIAILNGAQRFSSHFKVCVYGRGGGGRGEGTQQVLPCLEGGTNLRNTEEAVRGSQYSPRLLY